MTRNTAFSSPFYMQIACIIMCMDHAISHNMHFVHYKVNLNIPIGSTPWNKAGLP